MPQPLLGERILLTRRQRGMSQKALAGKAHCPYQVISRIESGHQDISSTRLFYIARALGVSMDYLAGMDTEENEPMPTAAALVGA